MIDNIGGCGHQSLSELETAAEVTHRLMGFRCRLVKHDDFVVADFGASRILYSRGESGHSNPSHAHLTRKFQ